MCLKLLPGLCGPETTDSGGHPLPPLYRCCGSQISFPTYEELKGWDSHCAEGLPGVMVGHTSRLGSSSLLLSWTLFLLFMIPTRQRSPGSRALSSPLSRLLTSLQTFTPQPPSPLDPLSPPSATLSTDLMRRETSATERSLEQDLHFFQKSLGRTQGSLLAGVQWVDCWVRAQPLCQSPQQRVCGRFSWCAQSSS